MAQKLYEESNIQAIADAIRGKNGLTNTYKTSEMAAAITAIEGGGAIEALDITSNGTYTAPEGVDGYSPITVNVPQDGSPPAEAFVISGDCYDRFANNNWNWFIKNYGNQITTKNITTSSNMFYNSYDIEYVPFEFNFLSSKAYINTSHMFSGCQNLKEIPKMNNWKCYDIEQMFRFCMRLRYFPEDIGAWIDYSYLENQTSSYTGKQNNVFAHCYSLRNFPVNLVRSGNPNIDSYQAYFNIGFLNCYALDELVNLPVPYTSTWTSNAFDQTVDNCYRLKNITFNLLDGQPYVMNWKSQVIDLSKYIGYARDTRYVPNYNSGITADKEVTDDATYQALKNDPDWFTIKTEYSRYNHDSAVATINSLPDTSAYLATAGGTNTIKFRGAAGSATDGGAINTLTESEIAVATAKGWTVSFA